MALGPVSEKNIFSVKSSSLHGLAKETKCLRECQRNSSVVSNFLESTLAPGLKNYWKAVTSKCSLEYLESLKTCNKVSNKY